MGLLLSCMLCLRPPAIFATGDSTHYLLPEDTLELSISAFNEKIITHYFAEGQTLYSLARFYGLTVDELKYYNPGLMENVAPGDAIQIPVPNRSIIRYPGEYFPYEGYVPLLYTVQKGDTFYGLSNRIFKMPPDEIRRRLIPMDRELKIGQRLFVGWIPRTGVPDSLRLVRGHPLFRMNQKLRPAFMGQAGKGTIKKLEGAAGRVKQDDGQQEFLVLFDGAPENSFVEITYPLRGRKVYAKVVGRIPPTVYGAHIKIVVSSLTAKLLGARDEEFFVRVQYY